MKWKAQCATNILKQLVRCRERRRRDGAAHASSQGQAPAPVPSIIMAGDLNTTKQALMEEMSTMHIDESEEERELQAAQKGNMFVIGDCVVDLFTGLPRIKGADNMHEVGCYDISVARTPEQEFPAPSDRMRVDDKAQERIKKVLADMQSALEAARAATQGQDEEEAKPEEPQSQEGDATQAKPEEPQAKPEEPEPPASPRSGERSRSRSPPPTPPARSRSPTPPARNRSPTPPARSRSPTPPARSRSPTSSPARSRSPTSSPARSRSPTPRGPGRREGLPCPMLSHRCRSQTPHARTPERIFWCCTPLTWPCDEAQASDCGWAHLGMRASVHAC